MPMATHALLTLRHRVGVLVAASALLVAATPSVVEGRKPTRPRPRPALENLCGWFENPTPANAWLVDRDGSWEIGVQGGHQAEGDWPVFKDSQWVHTNAGSYGYGCACIKARADRMHKRVLEIVSARAQSLAVCRADKSLPKEAPP